MFRNPNNSSSHGCEFNINLNSFDTSCGILLGIIESIRISDLNFSRFLALENGFNYTEKGGKR
jgi:hypothetical protein